MKKTLKNSIILFFLFSVNSLFGQKYQTITGIYYNDVKNAVNCYCNIQGYVNYLDSDGETYNLTVCFDSEPGDFYQIHDGEEITVEGNVSYKPCKNEKSYAFMDVNKSKVDPGMQRQMLYPEFTKNQGGNNSNATKKPESISDKGSKTSMSGDFILRGSTKDDWSIFNGVDCKACGLFYEDRDVIVNFDGTEIDEDALYRIGKIKVYGVLSGNIFTVSSWEKIK